mgnify:CR=1 FL=1|tara:strand:+ start:2494 stop:3120 length:627 start_codon:yes stop_codon:yes gene_type:complete
MTVTEIKTPGRKAPVPTTGSYVHSIYETIDALGGTATCAEVRELLPAAGGKKFVSNRDTHTHVMSIAVNLGYVIAENKFSSSRKITTEAQFGRAVYRIASFEHYEATRQRQLVRAKKLKAQRERLKEKISAEQTAVTEVSRMSDAIAKLKAKKPEADVPAPATPAAAPPTVAMPTVAPQSLTRTELGLITGTACFFSVSVYALLEQLL